MAFVNHFYNQTTRKYVALFGTLFNQFKITRVNNAGTTIQTMIVPISYAPWQKILSRVTQDPDLNQKSAITLPRLSFEMTSMAYDGDRKISPIMKIRKNTVDAEDNARNFVWAGAPYNIEFSLYIMAKYTEDGVKIIEQILPFFNPDYTTTVNLISGLDPIDVPLILNSVSNEELYEGNYEERRSSLWTLNFTMKAWYFGPEKSKKEIKFVDARLSTNFTANVVTEESYTLQPGLTANGEPTTDATETIPFSEINFDDNWAEIETVTIP